MKGSSTSLDVGATAVEYALMVSLIFMVVLTAVTLLGGNLAAAFDNAATLI